MVAALGILGFWLLTFWSGLQLDVIHAPVPLTISMVLLRSILQTGLFIIAHDSMHGSLSPAFPRINELLGRIGLALYAALPYNRCRSKHFSHHLDPATASDPDYYLGDHRQPLGWYLHFMMGYLCWPQMGTLLLLWLFAGAALSAVVVCPPSFLLSGALFWVLPLLLSSFQLFVFGTYLPHRNTALGRADHPHIPRSLRFTPLVSLLCCYHFGYHDEHHTHPEAPWYLLPWTSGSRMDATSG